MNYLAVKIEDKEMSYEELHDFMGFDEPKECEDSKNHKRIIAILRKRDAGEFEWYD